MNLDMVITLLEVAKGHGITGRDIEEVLDTNSTTAARMLRLFDRIQANGKEGLDLVEARISPADYRAKLRFLNADGEAFMARVGELLEGRKG
ncbi:hypothetical protein ACMXYO_08750 [Neptuniibacter sp. QD37_6]|uniref:hypothetical protein n=1 Tax=Neptuniibacter sp. QD37_6 TaxID=3398210 RepID=UPI0039F5CB31